MLHTLHIEKRRVCLIILCMMTSLMAMAQTKITGKVIGGDDGQPVIGASVAVKGTNNGVLTGSDGTFSLTAKTGDVLAISYIGYVSTELRVGSETNYTITIKPSTTALTEVVVTGYSSEKKKDITGSVAVVNVAELKTIPAGSPEQMLQGKASGLNIVTSGEPGGGSNIRIRGITSLGNVEPLVMIDGVQGSLRNINANDIASVQVLKDAGAAAIYGVRGSNGVIIVTTKKGSGKAKITYDAYTGMQQPLKGNVFNLLNTQEMADLTWLALKNSGQVAANGNPTHPQYGNGATPVIPDYLLIGGTNGVVGQPTAEQLAKYNVDFGKGDIYQIIPANKTGTDWFHEIFKSAPISQHTVTASGGAEKSNYLFSLGYFDQEGTLTNTFLKRYSVRANTTYNVKNNIRVGENAYIFYRNGAGTPAGNQGEGNPISMAYRQQPIIPVKDAFGNYAGTRAQGLGNAQNPYANVDRASANKSNIWDIQGNVFGEVDFLKHFMARTSFGGTMDNQYGFGFGYRTFENAENNASNAFNENSQYNRQWTWTNTLTYNQVFGNHSVKVLGGLEAVESYGRGLGGGVISLFTDNPNYRVLSNGQNPTNFSYVYQEALSSQFGKVDYAYNDKYLLSATVRRDGSSKFGPDSRWGVFPSFSAGWRLSGEKFFQQASWIDNLMLRGSYGILGSQLNVNNSNSFNQFGPSTGSANYDINGTSTGTESGFYATRIGNPKTGWEEDKLTNFGIDGTFFKSKVDFSLEYFKKAVSGLLFTDQAPSTVGGAALPAVNIGNIENNGFDFSTTYHGSLSSGFNFDIGAILTTYKSNITDIPGTSFTSGGSRIGDFVRNEVGHPIGAFYGYKVERLFRDAADVTASPTQDAAAPGRFKYQDTNGDNAISADDRAFFGDPNPDFTYGLNLGANFKGIDFAAFLYGSQGNDAINYVRYWTDFYPSFQGAKSKDLLYNSWTPSNTGAKTPIAENSSNFSNNSVPNSYYLEDASFLKLRSLIIGYTLPAEKLQRFGIDKVRVFVQGANLFTITNYTGMDPELIGSTTAFGIDYGNYPNNQKNYNFGLSLTF